MDKNWFPGMNFLFFFKLLYTLKHARLTQYKLQHSNPKVASSRDDDLPINAIK